MRTRALFVAKLLIVFGVAMTVAAAAQQPSRPSAKASMAAKGPVHEIELPQYPPDLPDGPNKAAFDQKCLLCHSARYVTMQPRFPKAAWEKTVKKMVDAYGAPISPAEQQQVVEYLVAIRGPEGK
jgi:cytochrome c5